MDIAADSKETANKRILVCDDAPDNLFLLQVVLEAEGYEVVLVESGEAALAQISLTQLDLILLDVMMPGISGLEVAQQIRTGDVNPLIPIILVTASSNHQIPTELNKLVDGIIHKPIILENLIALVMQTLTVSQPKLKYL